MSQVAEPAGERTLHLVLNVAGERVPVDLPVPEGPVHAGGLLPAFQVLSETVETVAIEQARAGGRPVSCCAGCGACCRQLVPISGVEARALLELVDAQPEEVRKEVRDRFAVAILRLEAAGLLEPLRHPETLDATDRRRLGLAYFGLQIPCPFLEEESCAIHPVRPLACREYLVASPPENCRQPSRETIDRVPVALPLSGVLSRLSEGTAPGEPTPWVPLVLALRWAEDHPEEPGPIRPGPDWAIDLVRTVTGRDLPPPVEMGGTSPEGEGGAP